MWSGESTHHRPRSSSASSAVRLRSGITRIAKRLNADHVPPPRRDRPRHGWAPTAVRAILHRELYRGVIIWSVAPRRSPAAGPGDSADALRPTGCASRPRAADHLGRRVEPGARPAWRSTARCRPESQPVASSADPRPSTVSRRISSTGFTRCSAGDGAIGGTTQFHGTGPGSARRRVTFYAWRDRKRGPEVCGNDVVLRQELVDRMVLGAIGTHWMGGSYTGRSTWRSNGCRATRRQTRPAAPSVTLELAAVERIQRGLDALLDGIGVPEELQARLREEKAPKQALTEACSVSVAERWWSP